MKTRSILLTFFLVVLCSCNKEEVTIDTGFLNEVLDIMENNSINRKEINWIDFRDQVFNKAESSQSTEGNYDAIQLALTLLGDNHSFLIKPDGNRISGTSNSLCSAPDFASPSIPDNIGYVKVDFFIGSGNEAIDYAEALQAQIKNQDHSDILGWIVDLRGNFGGNMWPMLAGAGPILGEGIAGYFIDPDDLQTSWAYNKGESTLDGTSIVQLADPYELINPQPRVAVLLDNEVVSSGEALAIAFVGRNDTKSFGSATCGLSTANLDFNLSDGSTLLLTVSYMADRNKNKYGVPIVPDEEVSNETIIQDAIEYINN